MKIVISNKDGKAYQLEWDGDLIGKKIGDIIKGETFGPDFTGYEFQITGGSDNAGFPMRPDVHGPGRKKLILKGGVGFHPKEKGERRKKTVHGNVIDELIVQLNVKVIKEGNKKLEEIFKKEEGENATGN